MTETATTLVGDADGVLRLGAGVQRGPFIIDTSLKVIGEPGVVLQGDGEGAIVRLKGRGLSVSFIGVTFRGGGPARSGGGIAAPNGGRVSLSGCRFEGCRAGSIGGGAVAIRRGELVALRTEFSGCSGPAGGAVLVSDGGEAKLTACVFTGCEASHSGAAVAARGGAAELVECDFRGCAPPAIRADDLGWLVDVRPPSIQPLSTLHKCSGAAREGAVFGVVPR